MVDWLDVSDTDPRISYTVGATPQTVFVVPFVFFADGDLTVTVDNVVKTLTTHYTVAGEGVETGGTVTFVTAQSNCSVSIRRNIAIDLETHIPTFGPLDVPGINLQFSRFIAILQELRSRAALLSESSAYSSLTLPDPETGKYLKWKADLSGLENDGAVTHAPNDYPVSTESEAIAGALNTALMTPLRTKQAIQGGAFFLQSGVGAVARSFTSKARDFISVKDFGAVGDGVANDRPAIQAAIDALTSEGTLHFPRGVYNLATAFSAIAVLNITKPIRIVGEIGSWLSPTSAIANTASILYLNGLSVLTAPGINQGSTVIEGICIGDPTATVRYGNHGIVFKTPLNAMFKRPLVRNVFVTAANLGRTAPASATPSGCALFVDNDVANTSGGFAWATIEQSTLAGGLYLSHAGDSISIRDVVFPPNLSDANACNFGIYANLISGAGNLLIDRVNSQALAGCVFIDNAESATIRDCTFEQIAAFLGARATMVEVGVSSFVTSGYVGAVQILGGSIVSSDNVNVPYLISLAKTIGSNIDHIRLGHNFATYPHALVFLGVDSRDCTLGAGIWWQKQGVTITVTADKYSNGGTGNLKVSTAAL